MEQDKILWWLSDWVVAVYSKYLLGSGYLISLRSDLPIRIKKRYDYENQS